MVAAIPGGGQDDKVLYMARGGEEDEALTIPGTRNLDMAHVDEVEIMIHTFYLVPIRSIIVCPPSIPLSSCPPPAPQINTNQTHQHICRIVAPTYPYR